MDKIISFSYSYSLALLFPFMGGIGLYPHWGEVGGVRRKRVERTGRNQQKLHKTLFHRRLNGGSANLKRRFSRHRFGSRASGDCPALEFIAIYF
jgi:hypothetical protein